MEAFSWRDFTQQNDLDLVDLKIGSHSTNYMCLNLGSWVIRWVTKCHMMPKGGKAFRNIFFVRMFVLWPRRTSEPYRPKMLLGFLDSNPWLLGWKRKYFLCVMQSPQILNTTMRRRFVRLVVGMSLASSSFSCWVQSKVLYFCGGPFNEQQKYYTPFLSEQKSASQEKARPSLEASGPSTLDFGHINEHNNYTGPKSPGLSSVHTDTQLEWLLS